MIKVIVLFLMFFPIIAFAALWIILYLVDEWTEVDYITQYPLENCLEYMKHDNIYDVYDYEWEENEGRYFITFTNVKHYGAPFDIRKPVFEVIFESVENGTKIKVIYLKKIIAPGPIVGWEQVNTFWKKKLNAEESK